MPSTQHSHGLGWLPDYPDFRDYSQNSDEVSPLLKKLNMPAAKRTARSRKTAAAGIGAKSDLREWCAPIEDQKSIGSCTAQAGVGLIEYFENRAHGDYLDASRLFLYKVTRNLMQVSGDTGAYLRTTMGAMKLFGVPPEKFYNYNIADYDDEPPAFCYAYAANYQAMSYFRLDTQDVDNAGLVDRIKQYCAGGFPSMFGFTVYSCISQANDDGKIPFPLNTDNVEGGHAVVVVGYDDKMRIKHTGAGAKPTTGAFLIRNSWGTDWGDEGYGWLPYEYVLQGQATDWWTLIKSEYVDTGKFGF